MASRVLYYVLAIMYVVIAVNIAIYYVIEPALLYRYPYILNKGVFIFVIIITVVVPAIVALIIFLNNKDINKFVGLKILLAVISLFIASIGSLLMALTGYVCSYTKDAKDYLVFDKSIDDESLIIRKYFPNKNSLKEKRIQEYSYFYDESACTRVLLSYNFESKDEFNEELFRIKSIEGVRNDENNSRIITHEEFFVDSYVFFDEENLTIDYYYCSGNTDYYDEIGLDVIKR